MTLQTVTLQLPESIYRRAHRAAQTREQSLEETLVQVLDTALPPPEVSRTEAVAQEWLVERLAPPIPASGSERERVRHALRAAGLLVELSPALRARIDPTVRLEDVETSLARADGKPLSDIVLEQRGPKG